MAPGVEPLTQDLGTIPCHQNRAGVVAAQRPLQRRIRHLVGGHARRVTDANDGPIKPVYVETFDRRPASLIAADVRFQQRHGSVVASLQGYLDGLRCVVVLTVAQHHVGAIAQQPSAYPGAQSAAAPGYEHHAPGEVVVEFVLVPL